MPPIPQTAVDIASLTVSTLGLIGLLLAYFQFRLSRKANELTAESSRSSFILEIHKWFRETPEEVAFFYRLDYASRKGAFIFDPENFPHSDDERQLDAILYKLVFVGGLLRRGIVNQEDIAWMEFIVSAVLSNAEVQKYLTWLQTSNQVPGHSEFVDAVFLFTELVGDLGEGGLLKDYIRNAKFGALA